jgi:hypothetical protein
MPKFRYSLDAGESWVVVDANLPFSIPAEATDTVWVEPIGATAVVGGEAPPLVSTGLLYPFTTDYAGADDTPSFVSTGLLYPFNTNYVGVS